ncbi:MAG: acylphosphatase [Phycisphaerae bacterium]|nr:acylphosphatase [Phycisphaerae bacterium]
MIRATFQFFGRVQGVGFRMTAKRIALRFALSGYVRNEDEGSVLCVIEGAPDEIDSFLAGVYEAMKNNITKVNQNRTVPTAEFDGFSIRN